MTDAAAPPSAHPPPDPLHPWPDDVAWRPVSRRLIWIQLLGVLTGTALSLFACLVGWLLFGAGRVFVLIAALVVVLGVARAVTAVRSVSAWGYAERGDDLLVRHGLLVRRLSIVPYARMQFVDVTAGPLERAFGLATVVLHTAAAASDARVPGLAGPEAARLRDRLAALGEARSEGL